ncbi:ATP synthase subunit s, mitochondrial [Bombus fervidus]|uniref:ATP synthase subunit s, mitochondrial n=1 Tax=Bombus fervidus TaxID=203811 RepID=UPI003AB45B37
MTVYTLSKLTSLIQNTRNQSRPFFYWLTVVFNRVDADRIKEIGPDRACAEWLLKNGASVRWKDFSEPLTDYNALPSSGNYYIESIEANNAGICDVGFPHLEGCKHIKNIKLESCRYIDNRAIPYLSLIKDSLTNLEIIKCKSIDDGGLRELKVLKNLKQLKIKGLSSITDNTVEKELSKALPNCKIDFE